MPNDSPEAARQHLGLSYLDLWIDYFALGGNLNAGQLSDYLRGERDVTDIDHNVIVLALNEFFLDRGDNHPLAYRQPDLSTSSLPNAQYGRHLSVDDRIQLFLPAESRLVARVQLPAAMCVLDRGIGRRSVASLWPCLPAGASVTSLDGRLPAEVRTWREGDAMLTGALVVESLRMGAVLEGIDVVVRRLSRSEVTDVSADQPTVWTLLEFTADSKSAEDLARRARRRFGRARLVRKPRDRAGRSCVCRLSRQGLQICPW